MSIRVDLVRHFGDVPSPISIEDHNANGIVSFDAATTQHLKVIIGIILPDNLICSLRQDLLSCLDGMVSIDSG